MVQRRSPFHTPAAGTIDSAGHGHHRKRPAASGSANDIHPRVSEGNLDCRWHQDLAPGRGASDHRSQNGRGREYPMVQRGPSLHLNRAGKTQQRRGTPDSLAGRTRIFGACADNRTRFQTILHPFRRGPLLLGQHNNFVRSCDQDVPTLRPGLSSPSLAAASLCSETAGVPYRGRTCEAESPTEMTHASLHAQFVPPTDLRPQTKMHLNVPCWCGSGKKWKRCHRNRESQPPVNVREQLSGLYREFQKGYCSHPQASSENCGHRIVRAHTVQRRGGLAAIAENGMCQ